MRTKLQIMMVLVALLLTIAVNAAVPERKGWWRFDDPEAMLKATIGNDLTHFVVPDNTGTLESVNGPADGNLAVAVPVRSALAMDHGIAGNGGGSLVNEFTLQIDFFVPGELPNYTSMFQTNQWNSGDGDLFIKADGTVGLTALGWSTKKVEANKWYRMVISARCGSFYNIYIDGELFVGSANATVDSRHALAALPLMFVDDDAEEALIYCAELAIWDAPLSEEQVIELGTATGAPGGFPVRAGHWTFEDPENLMLATIGQDLVAVGDNIASVEGPNPDDLAVVVPLGEYLTMNHGMQANLGGALVNDWTLHMDIRLHEIGIWHAFFQTGAIDGDADLFTAASDNTVGTSSTGYSTEAMEADTWYRMLVTVKNGEFFRVYVDGDLWLDGDVQGIDGRYGLSNFLHIFQDNDGDDGAVDCAELAIWNVALSGNQVNELGKVQVGGLPEKVGHWLFDVPDDLPLATTGFNLEVTGTVESVVGPVAGNLAARVPLGSYMTLYHGLEPSITEEAINEWSLMVDFRLPETGKWYSFFQTGATDGDADLFVRASSNAIGVGDTGYSNKTLEADTWYRMLVSVKNDDFFKVYVNGELWLDGAGQAVDGRFGLAPFLHLFQDNDGDDGDIDCAELAIWDVALNEVQAIELGRADIGVFPKRKAQWLFDDPQNLLKATVGADLVAAGEGIIAADGPTESNKAVMVPLGSYLTMSNAMAPSLGGELVNEWSLQIDFSLPQLSKWYAFFQTGTGDADLFVAASDNTSGRKANSIGTSSTGYSQYTLDAESWYRMVVSVKNDEFFKVYVNGQLWLDAPGQGIDGRWGLGQLLSFFQDDDGDDANIISAEISIWDRALTQEQALELGRADQGAMPKMKGHWAFEEAGNLGKANVGKDLAIEGTPEQVDGPAPANFAVKVPLGSYFIMDHGMLPNLGGTMVNDWTLHIDFKVNALDQWVSFFQTGALDGDADFFISSSNNMGVASTGYSTRLVEAGTWYRLIVSVKNGQFFNAYINGERWLQGSVQGIDGRFGLADLLYIFQDNDGEDNEIICAEMSIWDTALTAEQAAELGSVEVAVSVIDIVSEDTSSLGQNYPNPFSSHTTFPYFVAETGQVSFRIFDITGREIQTINEGIKASGSHSIVISAESLNPGIYFIQMSSDHETSIRKMIISK